VVVDDESVSVLQTEPDRPARVPGTGAAENGVDALSMVYRNRRMWLFWICQLPDMEGSEVIIRMKGDAATGRIPVLAMTGGVRWGEQGGSLAEFRDQYHLQALE
jgi:CheY-like chemotaxis protein